MAVIEGLVLPSLEPTPPPPPPAPGGVSVTLDAARIHLDGTGRKRGVQGSWVAGDKERGKGEGENEQRGQARAAALPAELIIK